MSDLPIIFSKQMVLALLALRKTMTRRLAWMAPPNGHLPKSWQRVRLGDRLWVRENLTCIGDGIWRYAADNKQLIALQEVMPAVIEWTEKQTRGGIPSIHMPRWASRITMEVTMIKIEPLQMISEDDAFAEGVQPNYPSLTAREAFVRLWCDLHGADSWTSNPDVVAISGQIYRHNIDALKRRAA